MRLAKVAVMVIMADSETHADTARVANALMTVYEFKEAGEEATLVFSGAGTRCGSGSCRTRTTGCTGPFSKVKDDVAGACKACAVSFGVREEVEASGVPLLTDYKGHQNLRKLVNEGYEGIVF